MSISFAALTKFVGDRFHIIAVQSSKCQYRVCVEGACARVQGPGVDDFEVDFEERGFKFLSPEAMALLAVVLFEEEEND